MPLHRFGLVLGHTFAIGIVKPEVVLRLGGTLLCGFAPGDHSRSTMRPESKPLSPASEKLSQFLIEIYAPIDWPSDEVEEGRPTPMPIESAQGRVFYGGVSDSNL